MMDISRVRADALREKRNAEQPLSDDELMVIYLSELRDETRFPEKVDFIAGLYADGDTFATPPDTVEVTVTGTAEQREGEIEHAVGGLEEGDTVTVTKKAKK